MNYTYASRTSDGVRHEAAMDAESREAVFVALRAKGIRAIKVVAADGSKANGEAPPSPRLRRAGPGISRIGFSFLVLAAALAGVAAWWASRPVNATYQAQHSPRHQIYGDPAIMERFERGEFGDALSRRGDQLLAWFSQPGRLACPRGTPQSAFRRLGDEDVAALAEVAGSDVEIVDDDSREVRELKQIVNGMRREMREYLANGNGTPRSYWRRLVERTHEEAQIYERARRELEKEHNPAVREERNAALRRVGIRTIPSPSEEE